MKTIGEAVFIDCEFRLTYFSRTQFINCRFKKIDFYKSEFFDTEFFNSELKKIYGSRIKMWYLNDTISSSILETILIDENQTKQAPQTDKNLDEDLSN